LLILLARKKNNLKQCFGFVDNRSEAVAQRKLQKVIDNQKGVTQMRINVGNEPDVPNNYRTITTSAGYTANHYGAGPFNIHAGVYGNNRANAGVAVVPVATVDGKSDHSSVSLLDRNWASNNTPELDHIVPVAQYGANSYNNARVLSVIENNNNAAARPGGGNIVTKVYKNTRIRDGGGYDNTINAGNNLVAGDQARVATFGGIGAVIAANSGDTANGVTIDQ
jgi:hypothetical protein